MEGVPWYPSTILNGAPCAEEGYFYPIKPYSYFCPVACGCRGGDKHCPTSCSVRNATEASALTWGERYGIDGTA